MEETLDSMFLQKQSSSVASMLHIWPTRDEDNIPTMMEMRDQNS